MVYGPRSRGGARLPGHRVRTHPMLPAVRRCSVQSHKAIIADTMKLLGNSGYGKTITNVDRHRDVNYCTEKAASLMVNDRRFRQIDVVVDDVYEIEMNKKTVTYTLPEQENRHVHPTRTRGILRSTVRQDAHVAVLLRFHQHVPGAPSVPVLRDGYRLRLFGLGRRVRRRPRDPGTTKTLLPAPFRMVAVRMLRRPSERVRALSNRQ